MKDIKNLRQDFHLDPWVMHAPGVGLWGTVGFGEVKKKIVISSRFGV